MDTPEVDWISNWMGDHLGRTQFWHESPRLILQFYLDCWSSFLCYFHPAHPQDGWVCTSPCECVSDTFLNPPSSPEEDEEKEIYCSSRGEGQFISDLWEGVFPRDQVTTVEEKEEDVEKEFILHITSEARLSLSSTTYNT